MVALYSVICISYNACFVFRCYTYQNGGNGQRNEKRNIWTERIKKIYDENLSVPTVPGTTRSCNRFTILPASHYEVKTGGLGIGHTERWSETTFGIYHNTNEILTYHILINFICPYSQLTIVGEDSAKKQLAAMIKKGNE